MNEPAKPDWIKIRLSPGRTFSHISNLLRELNLASVCEEAHCPNFSECWSASTVTFMALGRKCTRACRFCAVERDFPGEALDLEYPKRLAEAVVRLELNYAVLTSVCRDDLEDGGAEHLARCITLIKSARPSTHVEALIPDFQGKRASLRSVLDSSPDVLSHNIETVRSLQAKVRDPRASYDQSLSVLEKAKILKPRVITKSSMMLGFGESEDEVISTMKDLRNVSVDILTIGQYLRPSKRHIEVHNYIHPNRFDYLRELGERMGFACVSAGPLVRSSYRIDEILPRMMSR
ncbi:MAG: lipoyl synthase [archaeon]